MRSRIGHFQTVDFEERDKDQRKNEQDWARYEKEGTWGESCTPQVFISLPNDGKVAVKIWVYDATGHKSDPILFEKYPVLKGWPITQ